MGDQEATQLFHQLQQEWSNSSNSRDDAKISSLLSQLKVQLAQLGLLFPTDDKLEPGALSTAREILEIGALHSLRTSDTPSFERYLSLLQSFYQKRIPGGSSQRDSITALNLLRLLSQNRIAEFHTVLETLEKEIVESKPVDWVLKLERSLMEGSYSKVWSLCRSTTISSFSSSSSDLPLIEFSHFTQPLLETVRSEIATCDEKAYESLPLGDVKSLLFFENDEQVKEFAKTRNWYFSTSDNLVHFPSSRSHPSHQSKSSSSSSSTNNVPKTMSTGLGEGGLGVGEEEEIGGELDRNKVVSATLLYAKELESIV
ncbi:hypothetical protein JCM16303_001182 [Sporobolomyces ruberrimus]